MSDENQRTGGEDQPKPNGLATNGAAAPAPDPAPDPAPEGAHGDKIVEFPGAAGAAVVGAGAGGGTVPTPPAGDRKPLGKVADKWATLRAGEPDPHGDKVAQVYISTDHFIIYSVDFGGRDYGRLRSILPADYDSASRLRLNLAPVAGRLVQLSDVIASMGGRRSREGEPPNDIEVLRERTLDLMARAMQLAYEEQRDTASGLLATALDEVTNRRDSRNRMRYIWANTVSLTVLLALAYLVIPAVGARVASFEPFASLLGSARTLVVVGGKALTFRPVDVLAFGALGAFFSVSAAIKEVRVSHAITIWEMLYAGAVRIPIGVIGAAVVIVMVSGAWILGAVQADKLVWSLYLFGFIAGFSEYFVPNALKQAEGSGTVKAPGAK